MAKTKFDHFLNKFPAVELPVTLRDDTHHDFSNENAPLSQPMIDEFIMRYEATEGADDLTEYIACFKIEGIRDVAALVYWRAGLLTYDYVLATYDKTGKMIDKKAIAGTKVVDNAVKLKIATIDEKFAIYTAEGTESSDDNFYVADSTKTHRFEILENGLIEQDY